MRRSSLVLLLAVAFSLAARADDFGALELGVFSGDDAERVAAISRLSASGDPRAAPVLERAVAGGSAVVQHAAVRGLVQLATARAVDVLVDALDAPDPALRDEAHRGLMTLAPRPGLEPELVADFSSQPAMCDVLLATGGVDAAGRVAQALGGAPALRAAADRALRLSDRATQERAVVRCLEDGRDKSPCALFALDERLSGALPALTPLAIDPFGDPALRAASRSALVAMKDALDPARLATEARSAAEADKRATALGVLALFHEERSYRALVAGLDDAELSVRARAAMWLAEYGDPRAVGPLAAAAADRRNAPLKQAFDAALDHLTGAHAR